MSLSFEITSEQDDRAIADLRSRLYAARTLIPRGFEAYFLKRARYRSVHTSTVIEGNRLSEDEAVAALVDGSDSTNTDVLMLQNLDSAYDLVQQIAEDRSVRIDEGLIRAMNSVILRGLPAANSRGRYRLGPSLIVNSQTRQVRYRPPAPELVPSLMASLVEEVQRWIDADTYAGPVVATMAHFGLVSVHPFDDGNGRTARLLADMILQRTGWSGDGTLSVSGAILDMQQEYYDVLLATQGQDFVARIDVTPFVEFHTRALVQAATGLEEMAVSFNQRIHQWMDHVGQAVHHRQALAFMWMLDVAPLSTTIYAELTGTSASSALADLGEMVQKGWVERAGKGRNTRYRATPAFANEFGRFGQQGT